MIKSQRPSLERAIRSRHAMPMLPARHYVSPHTEFIRELLAAKPQIENEQRVGRAIFWDKLPSELDHESDMDRGRVRQKAYVYYSLDGV